MVRRETKDCKVTRETSVGKRWPGLGGNLQMKNKQLNENMVTQRRKKNKQSQHLENGKLDRSRYKGSRNYHELKGRNAND